MYFPQYLYHKQIHLGIQKHHESTQHIQRIQDIDLIDRFTMNQIISKNQNHIIHISIYPYLIYLYIYMYIIPYIKHMWFSHAPGADSHLSPSCRSRQVQDLDGVHLQGPKRNAVTSAPRRPWWSGGTCWLFPWHGTGRFAQKMTGITLW